MRLPVLDEVLVGLVALDELPLHFSVAAAKELLDDLLHQVRHGDVLIDSGVEGLVGEPKGGRDVDLDDLVLLCAADRGLADDAAEVAAFVAAHDREGDILREQLLFVERSIG